jgi:hypothetical protein
MQATLRFLSLFFLLIGFVLMGADLLTSMDKGGEAYLRSIDQIWGMLNPGSLTAFRLWVGHGAPWAARALEIALALWGWAVAGGLGVILNFLSGRGPARAG